jgi:hypothetical protein
MDGEKMALCRAQAGNGFMQEWMMAKTQREFEDQSK